MKTMAQWKASKKGLNTFLELGDPIDMEIVDYIIGVLPPITMKGDVIQMGEPFDACPKTGKARWLTIRKLHHRDSGMNMDGDWIYDGPRIKC